MRKVKAVTKPRLIRNLALIGFMGTGKSTIGHIVADELKFRLLDTDHLIESRTGKTISQIFADNGEQAFRELERDVINEIASVEKTVIACGGGLATNQKNLDSLKTHALVVCLWLSPEKIWERVRHQSHRPLLQDKNPLEKIRALLAAREPFYRQADVLVNTEIRSTKEVAQHVLHEFHLAHPAQR